MIRVDAKAYFLLMQKYRRTHASAVLCSIGVTRFELAASTSLRWRSSQTEPHPDMYLQHIIVYTYIREMSIKNHKKIFWKNLRKGLTIV